MYKIIYINPKTKKPGLTYIVVSRAACFLPQAGATWWESNPQQPDFISVALPLSYMCVLVYSPQHGAALLIIIFFRRWRFAIGSCTQNSSFALRRVTVTPLATNGFCYKNFISAYFWHSAEKIGRSPLGTTHPCDLASSQCSGNASWTLRTALDKKLSMWESNPPEPFTQDYYIAERSEICKEPTHSFPNVNDVRG